MTAVIESAQELDELLDGLVPCSNPRHDVEVRARYLIRAQCECCTWKGRAHFPVCEQCAAGQLALRTPCTCPGCGVPTTVGALWRIVSDLDA